MFSLQEYLNELVVKQDDEEVSRSTDIVELNAIICDDKWLARQLYYGVAGAMERQLAYLGDTLLPNTENKIARMSSDGVMGESYTQDSWFGTSNEDDPHINEEVPLDQLIGDAQDFAQQLRDRMRTAAIIFVTNVRAHDDLSKDLNQFSYGQIKAKAESNRQAAMKKTG